MRLLDALASALAARFLAHVERELNALLDTAHDAAVARMDRAFAARLLATKRAPTDGAERPAVFRTNNGRLV